MTKASVRRLIKDLRFTAYVNDSDPEADDAEDEPCVTWAELRQLSALMKQAADALDEFQKQKKTEGRRQHGNAEKAK